MHFRGHATLKAIKRALLLNPVTQGIVCGLIYGYIQLVYHTSRRRVTVAPEALPFMRGEAAAIFALWHARLLMMPKISPVGRTMRVMISGHQDGRVTARVMRFFGHKIAEGSSRRGGANAAREAIAALKAEENVTITPDGPQGPAMKVQPGAVAIARLTGKPVIPVTYAARACLRAPCWDRFVVPLPFSRIHYHVGAPFPVSDDVDLPALEALMVRQTEDAEAFFSAKEAV